MFNRHPPTQALRSSLLPLAVVSLVLALLALGAAIFVVRLATPWDGNLWQTSDIPSLGASGADFELQVTAVVGGSALQPGDQVAAIDGQPLASLRRSPLDVGAASAAVLTYELRSGTAERQVTLALQPFPGLRMLGESWPSVLSMLSWVAIAAYVFDQRPRDPAAQLLVLSGASFVPGTLWRWLAVSDIGQGPMLALQALAEPFYLFGLALVAGLAFVFPAPAGMLERHRRLALALVLSPLVGAIGLLAVAQLLSSPLFEWLAWLSELETLVVVSVGASLIVAVPWRYRSLTDALERRRFGAIVGTLAVLAALALAIWAAPSWLWGAPLLPWSALDLLALPIPLALGVAILRYGAFDLQRLVNRSLVYGGATAALALIYVFLVGMAVLNVHEHFGFAVALLATGLVILIAQPIRDGLQRAIDRLMYGDREDPYQGLARLAERLRSSLAPQELLPVVADTIAGSLRLPYVAIEVMRHGTPVVAAESGAPQALTMSLPLVHQAETVGRIVVAPRAGDDGFSATDRHLLSTLATQVGAAVKTVELDGELRRSRERLVTAHEEERRRLRRELHDGLGPTLAGSLLQLQSARAALATDPRKAADLLAALEQQTRQSIAEVRRMARDLRPPALDDLGLVGALSTQAEAFSADPHLDIQLNVPPSLPPLPAAVEVALYLITLESLANVAHHARAAHAWIELAVADGIASISISDDGSGMGRAAGDGVGLASMRERTAQLGGTLEIAGRPEGGTVVRARLPIPAADAAAK
jgi:two-component system NarL family sensor kinase